MKVKAELTLVVEYDLNGESTQRVRDQLDYAVRLLAHEGLLSGETEMEVDRWTHGIRVTPLPD